ncbi:hypothetical protein AB0392_22475 [Nonomuraea angiospora]|uniref:hypothetical protein n=1 Tax=Nonomuraea angiospora TaxID=46172 RepID=UPI003450C63B
MVDQPRGHERLRGARARAARPLRRSGRRRRAAVRPAVLPFLLIPGTYDAGFVDAVLSAAFDEIRAKG